MGKLVITRKLGQAVGIDQGRIVVTVVEVRGRSIKLAIEAPGNVDIERDDVADSPDRSPEAVA